jgi:Putative Ig domain
MRLKTAPLIPLVLLTLAALACLGGGPRPLKFSPDKLPAAQHGQAYNAVITVSQNVTPVGQMSVASGQLPPGLSLTFPKGQDAGEIAGTPTATGTYSFTVSVWCYGTNVSGQIGGQHYELVVE